MDWQENLVSKIELTERLHYVIQDPDRLCFEPYVTDKLEAAGVTLFTEYDPIALRMCYEEWLESDSITPFIIRLDDGSSSVPFDIEVDAIKLDFHISEIISNIDTSVLREINPKYYQQLINVIRLYRIGRLNKEDSLDFVLRHIYKIAPEIIQTEVDLVRLLIRKHYLGIEMPIMIENRLIYLLGLQSQFNAWNFSKLLPNRTEFFDFLQNQWQLYLFNQMDHYEVREAAWPREELIVPFDDQDIRVFIDNLFVDGLLEAVQVDNFPKGHWAWVGISCDDDSSDLLRFNRLLSKLLNTFDSIDSDTFSDEFWGEVAHEMGCLFALSYQLHGKLEYDHNSRLAYLKATIDELFETWLQESFGKLITIPSIRFPNMLHKVPNWLNKRLNDGGKICLLVMDGMGFQQWARIRPILSTLENTSIDERYSFAWVPTITSISRQALFSGKRPHFFSDSLLTTSKEEALWRAFWEDQGLNKNEVIYYKKVENKSDVESFKELVHSPSIRAAGLVINFIDEQMHGMKAGMSGLNAVLDDWLKTWQFTEKIQHLIDSGFEVVITADHGNQEAIGCGWPNEGVKAETKGERVRLYTHTVSNSVFCDDVVEWPAKKFGLPANIFPLVSKSNHAFIQKGKTIVGHGGISLHEVIVPFVTLKRIEHDEES